MQLAGCDAPRLDAELLLMHVWHVSRTDLVMHSREQTPEDIREQFEKLLERRRLREPLAYIIGQKEFWSRSFSVNPDVLIPRPETEHLIEATLEQFPDKNGCYDFCDIGTGSGCIAVTLACEYPRAHLTATDISMAALLVARSNAGQHGVSGRISFRQGDMLQALQSDDGPFDAVISNPPYVSRDEMSALETELAFEPHGALSDDNDGLRFLNIILDDGVKYLKPGGCMIVETGLCGLPNAPDMLKCDRAIHDLSGHVRGGIFRRL